MDRNEELTNLCGRRDFLAGICKTLDDMFFKKEGKENSEDNIRGE